LAGGAALYLEFVQVVFGAIMGPGEPVRLVGYAHDNLLASYIHLHFGAGVAAGYRQL
jgi:hypothetical protein